MNKEQFVSLHRYCITDENHTVHLSGELCFCGLTHFLNVPRLTPKNDHQRPTVVLLCGPHIQGAQGISCGRHLTNHEVEVILFLPNFVKMQDSVTSEVNLYSRTSVKQVASIKGRTHQ